MGDLAWTTPVLRRVGEMPLASLNSYVVHIEQAHRRSLRWPLWGNLSDGCGSATALRHRTEVGQLRSSAHTFTWTFERRVSPDNRPSCTKPFRLSYRGAIGLRE